LHRGGARRTGAPLAVRCRQRAPRGAAVEYAQVRRPLCIKESLEDVRLKDAPDETAPREVGRRALLHRPASSIRPGRLAQALASRASRCARTRTRPPAALRGTRLGARHPEDAFGPWLSIERHAPRVHAKRAGPHRYASAPCEHGSARAGLHAYGTDSCPPWRRSAVAAPGSSTRACGLKRRPSCASRGDRSASPGGALPARGERGEPSRHRPPGEGPGPRGSDAPGPAGAACSRAPCPRHGACPVVQSAPGRQMPPEWLLSYTALYSLPWLA
jgi:hypothetical protein